MRVSPANVPFRRSHSILYAAQNATFAVREIVIDLQV
jgi:hypothetical protein